MGSLTPPTKKVKRNESLPVLAFTIEKSTASSSANSKSGNDLNSRIIEKQVKNGWLTLIQGPIHVEVVSGDERLDRYANEETGNTILIRSPDLEKVVSLRGGSPQTCDAFDIPGINGTETVLSLQLNTKISDELHENQVVAIEGSLKRAAIRCIDADEKDLHELRDVPGSSYFSAHFGFEGEVEITGSGGSPELNCK